MISVVQRLEFDNIFPEEEQKPILQYLSQISKFSLLNIIGYSNTKPQPHFDKIFYNVDIQRDIIQRAIKYSRENGIAKKPILISREGSLRLAEIILENRESLLESNSNDDRDADELNLFKSYLIINQDVNQKQNFGNATDNYEKLVDMFITFSFPIADLPLENDNELDFAKLLYCTIYKFESLLEFLESEDEFEYLLKGLVDYFGVPSMEDLKYQVTYLFGSLMHLKFKNGFKWKVDDEKARSFLDSLVGNKIVEDEDFTNLKNYPIYKIEDEVYSVVDYFYVFDKFFKSVRFVLKDCFNKHHDLKPNDRTFFSFYNTNFSENHLMVKVLDEIFNKKYLVKKKVLENAQNEPDYYVRHNRRIFLFEHKDVLIRKDIKASADIEQIYNALKGKFLLNGNQHIGIGQLITSIEQILDNSFEFDDLAEGGNYEIYPILLVTDRIFDVFGLNYRMNEWFQESIDNRLGSKYNLQRIKPLTLIDMNTLIYWLPHLSLRDRNFKDILDGHHQRMKNRREVNHSNQQIGIERVLKGLELQMSPISNRLPNYRFPKKVLIDKFKNNESPPK